jgi:membrane fusion protein, heavy metal efflux system
MGQRQYSDRLLGLSTVTVAPQTVPIRLEIHGSTAYMTDFQSTIRPMFKGRADKVHVTIGRDVEKGDPLIDLYSAELAEAKSDFETKNVSWAYNKSLLGRHEELRKSHSISTHVYEETRRDEMKSRVEAKVARDKLRLYGLTDGEIARIEDEDGEQKARLTLRSPAGGVVISRDVVPGNLYDENDTLMVIAPLDRLWVWGHVFENDLDQVRIRQPWDVRFPHLDLALRGTVEHISTHIDPGTKAVSIRTSVPNPGSRLKSGMLVHGVLEIPHGPGRVVIPRGAMIVADGPAYVFVKVSGRDQEFERRAVRIAHETSRHVVIDEGLRAGEEVVLGGSLLLTQAYQGSDNHWNRKSG